MNMAWRLFMCVCLVLGSMALPAVMAAPVHAAPCTELIADGGFETGGAWQLGPNPIMAQYVTYTRHGGNRALALGITSGANVESYSSARQTVTIPPAATPTTLSFWFYAMAGSPATTDYMEVVVLDATGSSILAKPWYSHNDSRLWNQMSFDLTPLQGQTVQIYFNVYNDGVGGKAAMFLDDVSLQACAPGGTPTPTGTAAPTASPTGTAAATTTPTITPSPTPGCVDALVDGKFDNGLASWQVVGDPAGAAPVNAPAPVRNAPYALKLGSLDQNLNGLTTVRQLVTIPTGYPQVTLEAWVYTQAQAGPGADYQQVALLNSSGGLLYVPWQVELNNPAWQQLTFNVSAFAGQTVFVSFSVNNDGAGGRTAMFVDDARLVACAPGAAATATPTPTSTPTVSVTASPTDGHRRHRDGDAGDAGDTGLHPSPPERRLRKRVLLLDGAVEPAAAPGRDRAGCQRIVCRAGRLADAERQQLLLSAPVGDDPLDAPACGPVFLDLHLGRIARRYGPPADGAAGAG